MLGQQQKFPGHKLKPESEPVLSIITAIHNQRAMNQLFLEHLQRHTRLPYELIIIDNASTDASGEFFAAAGAKIIRNSANYSYPYTQNQGIAQARGHWLAFLNNDIVVPAGWDERLVASATQHGLDVITVCGIERIETPAATRALRQRWKRASLPVRLFGAVPPFLQWSHRWMYGNWEAFQADRLQRFTGQILDGYVGNSVLMSRRALDLLGAWDERIQAADADLYMRTRQRSMEHGDIRPMHIALDVFVHHYIRVTLRARPPAFADRDRLIPLEQKWTPEEFQRYSPPQTATA